MSDVVLIDGLSVTPELAKVSVYDRGFLYGDSVFETVRTYGGRLFALSEHLGRLARSAELVGIHLPVSVEVLAEETERGVREAGCAECYARVMITRGRGPLGLDPSAVLQATRVVLVQALGPLPTELYGKGVRAHCVQTVRAADAAEGAKLGNYLASVLALRTAKAAGGDEALVVNRDGLVVEGPTSNVFVVREGQLLTPPLEVGILAGITRALVIDLAEASGMAVRQRALTPEQVAAADEVFLTSSIREIVPVVQVDGVQIGDGKPGPATRALHRAFRAHVGLAPLG